MSTGFYYDDTPAEIKNAKVCVLLCSSTQTDEKGLHLITTSTPNGKKVQIMIEELKASYGTQCNTSSFSK
jgi:glutathione S-transferase